MTEEKVAQGKPEQPVGQQTEQTNDPWTPPQSSLAATPLSEEERRLTGLGGWLILVGIWIVIKPFFITLIVAFTHLPLILDGHLAEMTTEGTDTYVPNMWLLFWGELLINGVLICAWGAVAVLFFLRKKVFSKWLIGVTLLHPALIFLDQLLVAYVLPGTAMGHQDMIELTTLIVCAAIVISYALLSKRVRLTFVR